LRVAGQENLEPFEHWSAVQLVPVHLIVVVLQTLTAGVSALRRAVQRIARGIQQLADRVPTHQHLAVARAPWDIVVEDGFRFLQYVTTDRCSKFALVNAEEPSSRQTNGFCQSSGEGTDPAASIIRRNSLQEQNWLVDSQLEDIRPEFVCEVLRGQIDLRAGLTVRRAVPSLDD